MALFTPVLVILWTDWKPLADQGIAAQQRMVKRRKEESFIVGFGKR
jgi:hypothetical protein